MSRRIYCKECSSDWKPHPIDVQQGWQHRSTLLSIKKPADHSVTVKTDSETKTEQLESIMCDKCGRAILDGEIALAVTMWRDGEIAPWEGDYGVVIPPEAAKMVRTLEGDKT